MSSMKHVPPTDIRYVLFVTKLALKYKRGLVFSQLCLRLAIVYLLLAELSQFHLFLNDRLVMFFESTFSCIKHRTACKIYPDIESNFLEGKLSSAPNPWL